MRAAAVLASLATLGCGRLGFDTTSGCPDGPAGTGTTDDPFLVCSPAQLAGFTAPEYLDASFVLRADLDLAGVPFAGFGTPDAPFTGRLDGAGHAISNLTVTSTGGPAGLVNVARDAHLENLTLHRVTVEGTAQVGSVVGLCDRSLVRNTVVTEATIRGQTAVGGLVGEALECQGLRATLGGTVYGTVEQIGGVAGAAGSSAFLDIESTMAVEAPLASEVGGVIGLDSWSPVVLQNVTVRATVAGDQEVGGIVGLNGDGSRIFRTRFEGAIHGNTAVGGFVGGNYDSPFLVYSTSVIADVTGTSGVGGFSGWHYYRSEFYDSYFRGTLHGVGANQASFGGFFGDVEYYGWVERSYVDVTIDSAASTVGGFMGRIGYWSGDTASYDVVDSFSAAHVTGSSPTATVSLWVGENVDPNPLVGTGSRYWSGGTCVNAGGGGCSTGGVGVADRTQLELPSGTPLARWDFARVWQAAPGALPTLRLEQRSSPVVTEDCPTDAIAGLLYECSLAVVDDDVNEARVATLEAGHTCTWISAVLTRLSGTAPLVEGPACTLDLTVTDGPNVTPRRTIPIAIHAGVVVEPADASGIASFLGFQAVGSPATTHVLTLTNREAVPVELAIAGLPAGPFTFAGGTYPGTGGSCGTALPVGGTCTIVVAFAPTTAGPADAPLELGFTAARGPVRYRFTLSGYGT